MIEMVLQSDAETRPAASVREIDVAHPSKPKGTGFELEVVKVLQGYAIEAVKIPLSGSVAGFAGDIGAVLIRVFYTAWAHRDILRRPAMLVAFGVEADISS